MSYTQQIGHAYFFAKNYVISKGYWHEIEWQDTVNYCSLTQQKFMHEISWVILASGMSDKVVQKKFQYIREAMFGFDSAIQIAENRNLCFANALKIFNHRGKINAILFMADRIAKDSFEKVKASIDKDGIEYLKTFPYIGDATAFHLAKNIGLNVAKPDRHLARISVALGFSTPQDLCRQIAEELQEKMPVVDLILWRYATLDRKYLEKIKWMLNKKENKILCHT